MITESNNSNEFAHIHRRQQHLPYARHLDRGTKKSRQRFVSVALTAACHSDGYLQATFLMRHYKSANNCRSKPAGHTNVCVSVCCEYVRIKLKGILLSSVLHIVAPQPIVNVSHAMTVVMPLRHKFPFTGCNTARNDSIMPRLTQFLA